ncbi:MAG: pirin family protein [Bacteroidota bacterium]
MLSQAIIKIRELGFHWETKDPFMFCAYHQDDFPEGKPNLGPDEKYLENRFLGNDFTKKDGFRMYHGQEVPGFPGHPHAGFETITLVEKGYADHSDSLGAKGRFGNGDVQWMTAGKGILHSEMFPLVNQDKPNPLVLFQLWLNLPARSKNVAPHFKMFWNEDIPTETFADKNGNQISVKIIAGKLCNTKAIRPTPDSFAAKDENHINIWRISLDANAEWTLPKGDEKANRMLFFYEGNQIEADGFTIEKGHSLELNPSEDFTLTNGNTKAEFLFLEGKPIGEPVFQQGPFVANSRAKMMNIINRYQNTQFGGWPWEKYENVHEIDAGRFARHINGEIEYPKKKNP